MSGEAWAIIGVGVAGLLAAVALISCGPVPRDEPAEAAGDPVRDGLADWLRPARSYTEALARYDSLVGRVMAWEGAWDVVESLESLGETEAIEGAFEGAGVDFYADPSAETLRVTSESLRALRDSRRESLRVGRERAADRPPDALRQAILAERAAAAEAYDSLATMVSVMAEIALGEERFGLFTECAPVRPGYPFGAYSSPSDLRDMAEGRLRTAGIWSDDDQSFANTLQIADNGERVWFEKTVWDPRSGELGEAETWELSSRGLDPPRSPINLSDPERELAARDLVSSYLDAFIADYLRVNEGYC